MWTSEVPTTEGWYWFFGVEDEHDHQRGLEKPRLRLVEFALAGAMGTKFSMFMSGCGFLSPHAQGPWGKAVGKWMSADTPAPPANWRD